MISSDCNTVVISVISIAMLILLINNTDKLKMAKKIKKKIYH